MSARLTAVILLLIAGAAMAKQDCSDLFESFSPSYQSSTEDGEDSLLDPTPDRITVQENGSVSFDYYDDGGLTFTPVDQP